MNYQDQLLDALWKEKRKSIIQRDNLKCQNCLNESYKKNYNYGIIFSNSLPHKTSLTTFQKTHYLIHIWDLKNDIIKHTFTNNVEFSPQKSYVAIYKESGNHTQLLALKIIEDDKIDLNFNILDIIKNGLKGKVSNNTYIEIYKPEGKDEKWELVIGLHVHHKYYQKGLMAWDYPDDALITLCWECHKKLHSNTLVPILDIKGNEIGKLIPCYRCFGAGIFPEYIHVEAGICFRCDGAKYEELIH